MLTKMNEARFSLKNINLYIKDERTNPTGSFKDRGMPLLIADAKNKTNTIATVSTGNAAISLTNYAKRAGFKTLIFLPKNTPQSKINLLKKSNKIILDSDLIKSYEHFVKYCKTHKEIYMGFLATNIPYMQGVKTMAYEIYEQLGNRAPDWIVIPCGSGGNLVSIYQGFVDLLNMEAINILPRFVSVQIKGADPITQGYKIGETETAVIIKAPTISKASAIASDTCFNYKKVQKILLNTHGIAISVTDTEIDKYIDSINFEYSSLSVFAAIKQIPIKKNENVVLIGTARRR